LGLKRLLEGLFFGVLCFGHSFDWDGSNRDGVRKESNRGDWGRLEKRSVSRSRFAA
jgi:hypothetical protein